MESVPKEIRIDEKIRQFITYDESLYDLMCSLIGFEFTTENADFNKIILNERMTQGNALEVTYCSNTEKNPFLYFLLTEILHTNYTSAKEAGPIIEVVLFDNFSNLSVFTLSTLLLTKLSHIEDQNERELAVQGLLKRLFIYRPNNKRDFLLNLKSVWTLLDKNKFLRVVMMDSVNSFQFFEDSYKKSEFDMKDKRRASGHVKRNFNKEVNTRIQENIQRIVTKEKLCTILFKREYFKMSDSFNWDDGKSKFCINPRLSAHLNNRMYPLARKICLINFENINDSTLDIFKKVNRDNKNGMIFDRQLNMNLCVVKPDAQSSHLILATYCFSGLNFLTFQSFSVSPDEYYMTTRESTNNYYHQGQN